MFAHRIGYLKGGIDENAVETIELLSIHATHRGADNKVGLFLFSQILQHSKALVRVDRYILCHDFCRGQ